jgi:hypothetical protein
MVSAADGLGMIRTTRVNNHPPWFNSDCREKKRALRSAFRRRRRQNFDQQSLLDLSEARLQFAQALRDAESSYNQLMLHNIINSRSQLELWSAIRKVTGAKNTNSTDLTTASVTNHFLSLFDKFPTNITFNVPLMNFIPELDDPISLLELDLSIGLLKKKKSPGPDGLGNEFLIALDGSNRATLLSLFNNILTTSVCPDPWGKIKIFLIHKKGDTSDVANYRGISLMNCVTKLFTSILATRLSRWADDHDIIPEIQSGFRKHRGCSDNIFVLSSLIEQKIGRPSGKLFTAFIDFKQAFDGVNHVILWQKLANMGLSSRFINILISFYSVANAQVTLPQGDTETIPINNGVLQGDTLSPLLFSLFVHDLDTYIEDNYPDAKGVSLSHLHSITGLLYADDLVLFGTSAVQLNLLLRALNAYAIKNDLVINSQKSKVIVFRKGGNLASGTRFQLGNEDLEIVNRYQYLGVWFSSSGSFTHHVRETSVKAERAGAILRALLLKIGHFSSDLANTLIATKVTSTLLHAVEVWGRGHEDSLLLPTLRFIKKLFILHPSTPHHILVQEFGIPSLKATIVQRQIAWLQKVAQMSSERLPRICMERQVAELLRDPAHNSWFSRLCRTLSEVGINLELHHWDTLDYMAIYRLASHSISRVEYDSYYERAMDSSHCPMYRCLIHRSHFLRNEDIKALRLLLQMRLTNDRFPRLLRGGHCTKFSPGSACPLCNSGAFDSLAHFVLDCPVLAGYRPISIARVASYPGPETARLANVLNTRPLHLDLIAFVDVATRVRQLADIV